MPPWAQHGLSDFAPVGLNVWGVADGAPWQHVLPGCRSVLVIGSGGTTLWDGFLRSVAEQPARLELDGPLDARVVEAIAAVPADPSRLWIRCAADDGQHVDFRSLARDAGLGHPSRLGLLLHPTYGPWFALRAACFTTDALPVTGPLVTPTPCEGCAAPCTAACPVGAIGPGGWSFAPCVGFQERDPTCHGGCLARAACVVGREHAYGALQHRYHQHTAGRRAVLQALKPGAREPDPSS